MIPDLRRAFIRPEHARYINVRVNTSRDNAVNKPKCCKFVANVAIILNEKLSPVANCRFTGYK